MTGNEYWNQVDWKPYRCVGINGETLIKAKCTFSAIQAYRVWASDMHGKVFVTEADEDTVARLQNEGHLGFFAGHPEY